MAVTRVRISVVWLIALSFSLGGCAALPSLESLFGDDKPKQVRATAKGKLVIYQVRKGDTLAQIAKRFKVNWWDIARHNRISNPNKIKIGQRLRILVGSSLTGKKPRATATRSHPPAKPPSRSTSGISWQWPTQGKVIRKFSATGAGKKGIVISGQHGQKVKATAPGTVVYSGKGLIGYGNLIIVKHKKGFLSAYGHNRELLVKEGQTVKQDQTIAHMGDTAADSPRLHFEVRFKGEPVDPLKYLP